LCCRASNRHGSVFLAVGKWNRQGSSSALSRASLGKMPLGLAHMTQTDGFSFGAFNRPLRVQSIEKLANIVSTSKCCRQTLLQTCRYGWWRFTPFRVLRVVLLRLRGASLRVALRFLRVCPLWKGIVVPPQIMILSYAMVSVHPMRPRTSSGLGAGCSE
jgi:hypothetical protein